MSTLGSIHHWARQAAAHVAARTSATPAAANGVWHWINSVAQGVKRLFSGPLAGFAKAVGFWGHYVFWWDREVYHAYRAAIVWIINGIHKWLTQYVNRRLAVVEAEIRRDRRQLLAAIVFAFKFAVGIARYLVGRERLARLREIAWVKRDYKTRIKWLHQAIEREAVSGYKAGYDSRLSTIQRVADLIANDNPLVRGLVKRLVTGVLDLAAVDDPVARIALGFILRHVVDRLGLDKVLGHYLSDLLAPLLGAPKPRGLAQVIVDLGARIDGIEKQWAEFMANGGPEVEQAGKEWEGIASLAGDAALLVFFGEMCYRPASFGRELSATAGTVINDTIIGAADLLRKV